MPPKETEKHLPIEDAYFIVWCPDKPEMPPRVKHYHRWQADNEADRLARLNPGQEFVVLEAVSSRVASGMVRKEFVPPVPF